MKRVLLLLLEQLVILLSLVAFLYGFNTLQPFEVEDTYIGRATNDVSNAKAPKVVLMVIDGLRTDHMFTVEKDLSDGGKVNFKYCDKMPYLASVLGKSGSQRQGLAFEVVTSMPTVTAPRIQSVVSGHIPGFLSMASNFATSRASVDNLLARWRAAGRRVRLYGDDTWVKLFPDAFDVADPVTSFFVSDHTQVDDNVTRHVPTLVASQAAWDVTILHYLGLDHIGHTHGATGPLITAKLREMDMVVEALHIGLQQEAQPYLLLVTGDHGMLTQGGHGGATREELHTAAAVLTSVPLRRGPSEPYVVRQVDVAPTLAAVTGVPTPSASVGAALGVVTQAFLGETQRYAALRSEAERLTSLAALYGIDTRDADLFLTQAHRQEIIKIDDLTSAGNDTPTTTTRTSALQQVSALYAACVRAASEQLVEKMVTYDLPLLVVAAGSMFVIALCRLLPRGTAGSAPLVATAVVVAVVVWAGVCCCGGGCC